ncbi:MAG: hypothetical protein JO353_01585 [Phycisphaerae bacterium]|nr:hypothetical protein [Phycisphaerae bacterium]
MMGEAPVEAFGWATQGNEPRFREVPGHVSFQLRFPSGALGYCACGFDGGFTPGYRAMFQKGYVECLPGFPYVNLELKSGNKDEQTRYEIEPRNHFACEYDYFADCVMNGKPVLTGGEEGLADLKVIEAINRSIASGKVEKV